MTTLNFARIAVTVTVRVGDDVVEPNTGFSAQAVGHSAAAQVDEHVRNSGLGYYPAIDFYRDEPTAVDPALLDLLDELAGYCAAYARSELRRRLRRVFSVVEIGHMAAIAYTMPRVRRSQPDRLERLAAHYAPHELRCELLVTVIEKQLYAGLEQAAGQRLLQWAGPAFEQVTVVECRLLPER